MNISTLTLIKIETLSNPKEKLAFFLLVQFLLCVIGLVYMHTSNFNKEKKKKSLSNPMEKLVFFFEFNFFCLNSFGLVCARLQF